MKGTFRRAAFAAVPVFFGLLVCCGREKNRDNPSIRPTRTPVDRLAPGELPPGVDKAHDLVLPRGSTVVRRFGTAVYADVPLSPAEFVNHARRQSDVFEAMSPSPAWHPGAAERPEVYTRVVIRGANTDHHLRVEVSAVRSGRGASVLVDRIEARPGVLTLGASSSSASSGSTAGSNVGLSVGRETNEELMRRVGLTPDGKLLDPKNLR